MGRTYYFEWEQDGVRAVLHGGDLYPPTLSFYGVPSMTKDDGEIAIGLDAKPLIEYLRAPDNCPGCGAPIRAKEMNEGGGVECSSHCGWWFCF